MCYCDLAEFIERGIFIRCCAVNCVLFSLSEIIVPAPVVPQSMNICMFLLRMNIRIYFVLKV